MEPHAFKDRLTRAIALQQSGRPMEAVALFREVLRAIPGHPLTCYLCGLSLQEAGRAVEALEMLSRAVVEAPGEPDYHRGLAIVLKKNGKFGPARERLRTALGLDPQHAETHFHLGDLEMDLGRPEEAAGHLHRALELAPGLVEARVNLGLCHKALGDLEGALDCFEAASAVQPDNPEYHVNRALTLLMAGRYPEGWQAYEWRLRLPVMARQMEQVPPGIPRWTGESPAGKTVLVLSEQGFGDNINFIRFLPQLAAMGAITLLEAPDRLRELFRDHPGIHHFVSRREMIMGEIRADCHIPLLSLPGLLHTTPETIPNRMPYLQADPALTARLAPRVRAAGLKVGLYWEGKPLHANDPARRRSCPPAAFVPLAGMPGVTWFSLQTPPEGQALSLADHPLQPVDLGSSLEGFHETAALLTHLDLLITIDTAIAHLGAALGKPVWLLVPFAPDWRWGMAGETTPWYPTLRLFRQATPGDWSIPLMTMAKRLRDQLLTGARPPA
ncbi:MAG: glycosyltransferase family protein [Magnetococcales bacterium]|nr:glycosyltransferase family protein [Magnetococcales bacterium]